MTASDHLSEQQGAMQYLHGTAARVRRGSMIVPGKSANFESAADVDTAGSSDTGREHAFATTELDEAYRYAENARWKRMARNMGRAQKSMPEGLSPGEQGRRLEAAASGRRTRGHVYEVEPVGHVEPDPEDSRPEAGLEPQSFQSKEGFRVVGRVPYRQARQAFNNRRK